MPSSLLAQISRLAFAYPYPLSSYAGPHALDTLVQDTTTTRAYVAPVCDLPILRIHHEIVTVDGALNKQPTNSALTGNAARASMAQPVLAALHSGQTRFFTGQSLAGTRTHQGLSGPQLPAAFPRPGRTGQNCAKHSSTHHHRKRPEESLLPQNGRSQSRAAARILDDMADSR